MPDQLQLRGGTTTEHATFTGASKEVTIDTTKKTAVVHDASTAGGNPLMREDGANSALINGSVTEPALAFAAGDADNGIYSPGTDQVAITTNGVERVEWGASEVVFNDGGNDYDFRIEGDTNTALFFVDASTDRVGVGTTSPISELHVEKATQAHITVKTASSNMAKFGSKGNDVYIAGTSGSANVIFKRNVTSIDHPADSGTETFRIDSSGRVGIGTSSPEELLHLQDASGPVIRLENTDTTIVAGNSFGSLEFECNDTSNAAGIVGKIECFAHTTMDGSAANGGALRFFTSDAGPSRTLTEHLRIDSLGRVGIGSTAPNTKLQVGDYSGANSITIGSSSSTNGAILFADGTTGNEAYRGYVEYKHSNDVLVFGTGGADKATIDGSGRLLVGTSSSSGAQLFRVRGNTSGSANAADIAFMTGTTSLSSGSRIATLAFQDGNENNYASITVRGDGTSGSNDYPGRIEFSTTADGQASPTERMRLNNQGYLKQSNSGTYHNTSGTYSEFVSNAANHTLWLQNSNGTNPYGLRINYTLNANDTGKEMIYCVTNTTLKMSLRSNGGIANYQSNNVNLCDEREKKNIESLDSTWGCLKNWDLKKFHYNEDADTDDKRYGVIAQQVAEHCPEVITEWIKQKAEDAVLDDDGNVVTPAVEEVARMGVKEQQMMWMAIKALQEAQVRIETLEAEVAALKGA